MFFLNKNVKIIKHVMDYYEGKADKIPFNASQIDMAIEYTKKNRSDYPDDIIEKLIMVKTIVEAN